MKPFLLLALMGFMATFRANAYDFSQYYDFVIEINGSGEKIIVDAEPKTFANPIEIPSPEECTSITIPSDIMGISESALGTFQCKYLKLENSDNPLTVGYYALNTEGLDKLYMGRNINCHFGFNDGGKLEMSNNVTEIADNQFQNATKLSSENIAWSTSITNIGDHAFEGCSGLTQISLPESVEELGVDCFRDCYSLTDIKLSENLKTIRIYCFRNCGSMKSVVIPSNVERIEECVFEGCDALGKVVIEDSDSPMTWSYGIYDTWSFSPISPFYLCPLEDVYIGRQIITEFFYPSWGEFVYDGFPLFKYIDTVKKITFGNKVTTIRSGMFNNLSQLETVIIGNSIKDIRESAFQNCKSLKDIIFPESTSSLERIGSYAFSDCESLNQITIPEGVTTIGESAYSSCRGAKSIVIPSSVRKIPEMCFEHCEAIEQIIIPENVDSICTDAFRDCLSLKDINIADSKNPLTILSWANIYHFVSCFDNCPVENIYEGRNIITNLQDTNDFTFSYETALSTLRSVWLGDFVTELTDGFPCENLKNLRLSPSLRLIGKWCFGGCSSLETIDLPDVLETIGDYAFIDCHNLQKIVLPTSLTKIGSYAFEGCYQLKEMVIPGNVKKIGDYAFLNVPLKRLVIEDGVEHIGFSAFTGGDLDSADDDRYIHTIIVNSPIPPICDDSEYGAIKDSFGSECYKMSELIVPSGSEELYATAEVWKNFRHVTSDVKEINTDNIKVELRDGMIYINGQDEIIPFKIFNINGSLIYSGADSKISLPDKGIFILKIGNYSEKIVY